MTSPENWMRLSPDCAADLLIGQVRSNIVNRSNSLDIPEQRTVKIGYCVGIWLYNSLFRSSDRGSAGDCGWYEVENMGAFGCAAAGVTSSCRKV